MPKVWREGVVLIKETTTLDDLLRFTEVVQQRFGIRPLQIFIHRDEGHYENGTNEWKPNLHAHIVWDWINHASEIEQLKKDQTEALEKATSQLRSENEKLKASLSQANCDYLNSERRLKTMRSALVEIGKFLMEAMEVFAKAVRSLMNYIFDNSRPNGRAFLTNEEAMDVKVAIHSCSLPKQNGYQLDPKEIAMVIGVTAAEMGNYDDLQERRDISEAIDVAKGRYDARLSRAYNLSR